MIIKNKNKYRAKKCSCEFQHERYEFDSKAEMQYFLKLTDKLRRFEIEKLSMQPSFVVANAYRIDTTKTKSGKSKIGEMKYTPDFKYTDKNGMVTVVEVKGFVTPDYTMRKKLFLASAYEEHGVSVFIEAIKGKETIYYCNTVKKEYAL